MSKKKQFKKNLEAALLTDPILSQKRNKWIVLAFGILLISFLYFLRNSPWFFVPIGLSNFISSSEFVFYNLKLLLLFKGGYAKTIWGWLVFISISAYFCVIGRFVLLKILAFRRQRSAPANESSNDSVNENLNISHCLMPYSKAEITALSWLLGSWVCGMGWFLLGSVGLFKKAIALPLIVLGFLIFCVYLVRWIKKRIVQRDTPERWNWRFLLTAYPKFSLVWIGTTVLALWIFSWSALCVFPQSYWDTLMVNMALPGYYVAESRLAPNPFNIYSYFAQNTDLLLVWTLLANSSEAAFLLIWGFFVALVVFMFGWLARVTSKSVALASVALFVSSMLGPWLGTYIKNDLQIGIFLILQWWALLSSFQKFVHQESDFMNWQFLAGLFAGIACGHKFTAVPTIAITYLGNFLFFLFAPNSLSQEQTLQAKEDKKEKNGPRHFKTKLLFSAKAVLIFSIGLFVAWGPWLVRNFLVSGNPIYPFLNKLFGGELLFPWHTRPPSLYTLAYMGLPGLAEYIRNLTQFRPVPGLGGAAIWWGPSAWLCFSAFLSLSKFFSLQVRWISAIAIVSWLFSLIFALKPPYHTGPIIFVLCCCFGLVLHAIFQNSKSFWLRFIFFLAVIFDFIRNWLIMNTKALVLFSASILISGSPAWHFTANMSGGTPYYATIDEMEWIHYLINKYTPQNDKVLFMGTVRPYGIERKHYAGFTLDKQPILFFAEKSKDALALRDELLRLGVRHLILDPSAWNQWIRGETVDGNPNIKVEESDLSKINQFMNDHLTLRFKAPSNKLLWFTIRSEKNGEAGATQFPPVPFDSDDVYRYPFLYMDLARNMLREGERENGMLLLKELSQLSFIPNLKSQVQYLLDLMNKEGG